jgi:hypothetical protein
MKNPNLVRFMPLPRIYYRLLAVSTIFLSPIPALALPPAADLPEEYLRAQIIVEARSPLDGQVISAAEYADFMAQQARETADQEDLGIFTRKYENTPDPNPYRRTPAREIANRKLTPREIVFLLRVRKLLSSVGIRINLK